MSSSSPSGLRGDAGVRGFVVAGGRSSRMGRDKALLPYRSATLLDHAISKARSVTHDVRILCGPFRRYEDFGAPVTVDAICGVGPIGGLYSALLCASHDGRDRIFWLGVDLPLVPAELLTRLLDRLGDADVAMAQTEAGAEPLCAAFRTEPALVVVRRSLLAGRLKLTSALDGLELHDVDADAASFANLNSLSDYEQVLAGEV